VLSPVSRYCFEKSTQPREIGEPVPLAGARILQCRAPDRAALIAFGLSQTQEVDTIRRGSVIALTSDLRPNADRRDPFLIRRFQRT
jgi:hypothetical protein